MANKHLFRSLVPQSTNRVPAATAKNAAGGAAYALSPAHALAQLAVTGTFQRTFYASAEAQLGELLAAARSVEPELAAKTAIYARERHMKDAPALLCALLASHPKLLATVFDRVIDDGKMLRLFVQMIRSGVAGRRSLGTRPKKLVEAWLDARTDAEVFHASIGNAPSLADVIRLAHPAPKTESRRALYAYLLRAPHDASKLPPVVLQFEAFKKGDSLEVPDVPFTMLTGLPLSQKDWTAIALRATWTQLRMNLATFARHGVFLDAAVVTRLAAKLRDASEVRKARVFPYQLLTSFQATQGAIPRALGEALQDAMEIATENVGALEGRVHVLVDVSGSMGAPVTGFRAGSTTFTRCVDVAALVAASLLRAHRDTNVVAFEQRVRGDVILDPRDTVTTTAARLAAAHGGGTNCGAALEHLNACGEVGALVIYVSDNESWIDSAKGRGTAVMRAWNAFRARNPDAKLVCIDLAPNTTTQALDRPDILNVGGFSDAVFETIARFQRGETSVDHWLDEIRRVPLAA